MLGVAWMGGMGALALKCVTNEWCCLCRSCPMPATHPRGWPRRDPRELPASRAPAPHTAAPPTPTRALTVSRTPCTVTTTVIAAPTPAVRASATPTTAMPTPTPTPMPTPTAAAAPAAPATPRRRHVGGAAAQAGVATCGWREPRVGRCTPCRGPAATTPPASRPSTLRRRSSLHRRTAPTFTGGRRHRVPRPWTKAALDLDAKCRWKVTLF